MPLDEALADALRQAQDRVEHSDTERVRLEADRNRLVLEASSGGASLREISRVLGLHHSSVSEIIAKG